MNYQYAYEQQIWSVRYPWCYYYGKYVYIFFFQHLYDNQERLEGIANWGLLTRFRVILSHGKEAQNENAAEWLEK